MHTRIELAVGRTRAWLATLLESRVPLTVAGQFDLVVLADLCAFSRDDDVGAAFLASAGRILAQNLEARPAASAYQALLATDARRALLAYRALRHASVRCPPLEDFVGGLAASLALVDPPAVDTAETSFLCRISGLPAADAPAEPGAPELPPVIELLGANGPAIQRILDDVARACRFGLDRSSVPPPTQEVLRAVLPVWILDFARSYQLASMAATLRTLAYVGATDAEVMDTGIRFLLDQQNPSGWFGFFGPELARIRAQGRPFNADAELYLPSAVACHWALLESIGPHRFLAPLPEVRRSDLKSSEGRDDEALVLVADDAPALAASEQSPAISH